MIFIINVGSICFGKKGSCYFRVVWKIYVIKFCVIFFNLGFLVNKSIVVFMDSKIYIIFYFEIGDLWEVDRYSLRMEKILVEKGLKYLVYYLLLVIWEVIFDVSRIIIVLMSNYIIYLYVYYK